MAVNRLKQLAFLNSSKFLLSSTPVVFYDAKLLSGNLQSDELGLARAVDLVEPVQKTLTEGRSQSYLDQKIWPNAVKDANNNNVEGHSMREQQRSAVSSRSHSGSSW